MSTKLKYLAPLIVFLTLAVFLGVGLTLNPTLLPSTLIGKPAPSFEVKRLHQEDTAFSPDQLLGQKWLLNIWASWCVGCRVEHPLLNMLAQRTNITMVGLNYKDNSDAAKQWLLERGDPYSIIPVDQAGDVGIDYGVYGVPETFVIDEQGIVVFKHTGPLTAQVVEQDILPHFAPDNAGGAE